LLDYDNEKKIISVKEVKRFGTEGRRNGQNEIEGSDTIL